LSILWIGTVCICMEKETEQESKQAQHEELKASSPTLGAREAYNIVSDTVVGVNFRKSDNRLQAKIIAFVVFIGAVVGFFLDPQRIGGAIGGAFLGLIAGLFISGFFLMIYRAGKHIKGDHS
jgi:hypothetical protein